MPTPLPGVLPLTQNWCRFWWADTAAISETETMDFNMATGGRQAADWHLQ